MPRSVLMASASPKLLIEDACLKLQVRHVIGTELIPGALKTQVQHFVGENVAWEKLQPIEY